MTYTIPSYTVQPGSVYQPKLISAVGFPVDFLAPNVVGCWSTRQLLSTGIGNIIRGRDATTNEEDFTGSGYPAGVVTLASGGDAFCTQLYDQSGNGNHATQAVAASQPKLVDAGTLIVDASGKPVVEFGGVDDKMSLGGIVLFPDDFTLFLRLQFNVLTQQYIVSSSSNNYAILLGSASQLIVRINSFQTVNLDITVSTSNYYTLALKRKSGIVYTYIDGVEQAATISNATEMQFLNFGPAFTSSYPDMQLSDAAAFDSALSPAQITQLHNAIA